MSCVCIARTINERGEGCSYELLYALSGGGGGGGGVIDEKVVRMSYCELWMNGWVGG